MINIIILLYKFGQTWKTLTLQNFWNDLQFVMEGVYTKKWTLSPETLAFGRLSKALGLKVFSGTRPPQDPILANHRTLAESKSWSRLCIASCITTWSKEIQQPAKQAETWDWYSWSYVKKNNSQENKQKNVTDITSVT